MSKKIIIMDDEADIRTMMASKMQSSGYEASTAEDGKIGFELVQKNVPDLVIMDQMMPKMNGFKVCGLLKSDKRFQHIHVVMFTARIQEEDSKTSQEVGVDLYLSKLTSLDDILGHVRSLIGE